MIIRSDSTTKIPIQGGTIWDYPMPSEDIGIALQVLNGRGPQKGKYLNTVCHEIYFIISGSATFYLADSKHRVGESDVVIVETNTPHHIDAHNLKYITITQPNWYEEQYREIGDS